MAEWRAFWALDPWGPQRTDLQFAQVVWAILQPQTKTKLDANDFRLFPDEAHDLPDDVEERERQWMMKLSRSE